ncbi:MAG: argininosuccinate lyase [Candidatus Micrarchaeota archaeon]
MKKMLWGGRFGKGPSEKAVLFNSAENIALDERLIPYDILGSLAHARMLYSQEIIPTADYESIATALKRLYGYWKEGRFGLEPRLEDVHMNVESAVTRMTGAGKKLHTARSRNDQVLLDMRLFMRDRTLDVIEEVESLREAFAGLAKNDGPMAAYTHTRVAQPITVSFWCQGWHDSLSRDIERLQDAYKRINQSPLGACAVAGTAWKIDRKETAALLAFPAVQENAFDTINSRGECETELLAALSLLMCKLSRLSEELIWLSQKGLVGIAEEHTTGSSIMPNKKNPDVLELVRGRTGRVYGNLNHCLTALKGLMSGYNSDMQETKAAMMGGLDTAEACLDAMAMVVRGLKFDRKRIEEELDGGFAQATEIADYLAMHGMPFREAHEMAGRLVKHCEKDGRTISAIKAGEASKLLGMKIGEENWAALKSLSRPRLKAKFRHESLDFADRERAKIEAAFSRLL